MFVFDENEPTERKKRSVKGKRIILEDKSLNMQEERGAGASELLGPITPTCGLLARGTHCFRVHPPQLDHEFF